MSDMKFETEAEDTETEDTEDTEAEDTEDEEFTEDDSSDDSELVVKAGGNHKPVLAKKDSFFIVRLEEITKESNPRDVFPILTGDQGLSFITLIGMAISPDSEQRAEFVRLVEEFENESHDDGKNRVTDLAASIRNRGQMQAIGVLKNGTKREKVKQGKKNLVIQQTKYRMIFGGRRVGAVAYNHAKHGDDAVVISTIPKCRDVDELLDIQIDENANRLDFTDLTWGDVFNMYKQDMGLNYQEIADRLGKPYQFVRGRAALSRAQEDNPKLIEKLDKGEITMTNAIRSALGEKVDPKSTPKEFRQRPLTIKAMQAMFDQTSRDNNERLECLAQCMQVGIDEELEVSNDRNNVKHAKKIADDDK